MAVQNHWYIVTSHGAILFYVALNPDCTIRDIADAMSLTRRTVWGIIGDLRRVGMLHVRKNGRRHHYTVNMDAALNDPTPFRHAGLDGLRLRTLLGELIAGAADPDTGRPLQPV